MKVRREFITYPVILILLGVLLYFLSMFWMDFLYRPTIKKEIDGFLLSAENTHAPGNENDPSQKEKFERFSQAIHEGVSELPLFFSHFDYYEKIAPAFKAFEDPMTYLGFWEGQMHSSFTLPIIMQYRNGELLAKSTHANLIPGGSILKSMNGKPVEEILDQYKSFVYGASEEETKYWLVEREILNFLPEFSDDKVYNIDYTHNGEAGSRKIERIPWTEYKSWRDRVTEKKFEKFDSDNKTVIKVYDFRMDPEETSAFRKMLEETVIGGAQKLTIDLTDAKGEGSNYYPVQLLLSFISEKKGFLIPVQLTRYRKATDLLSVIPQETVFEGELKILVSACSIWPHTKAAILFCYRNDVGKIVGEAPIAKPDFYSNPTSMNLPNSYFIPKICRQHNLFGLESFSGIVQ